MAGLKRHRKSGKRHRKSHKRGGMYGVGAIPVTQLLTMSAGALVAAKYADSLLNKIPVKTIQDNQKVKDGLKAALGVGLTFMKNEYAVNAGLGMAAYGVASLLSGVLPAISGTGKYEIGTGPTFMGALGPQSNYLNGIERWDGIGTEPDMIAGDFSDDGGLTVV
ncbi:hypothetical protein EBZ38_05455 [bacterium]|nr:hypothetical protein [bacterium]